MMKVGPSRDTVIRSGVLPEVYTRTKRIFIGNGWIMQAESVFRGVA